MPTTVQNLIDILQKIDDKSLPVLLECDHSQTPMHLNGFGEGFVESLNDYMLTSLDDDELEEYDNPPKAYFLQAY